MKRGGSGYIFLEPPPVRLVLPEKAKSVPGRGEAYDKQEAKDKAFEMDLRQEFSNGQSNEEADDSRDENVL